MMRRFFLGGCLILLTLGISSAESQEKAKGKKKANPTYTSAQEAGPDFAIQGEYLGEVELNGGDKHTVGAQVIALGDGKFRVKFHLDGLPGAGWDGKTLRFADAQTREGKTVFSGKLTDPTGTAPPKDIGGGIDAGVLTAEVDGRTASFHRLIRHSPTQGGKAPPGAIVLFDGTNTEEWKGGKLVEGNLLSNGTDSKRQFKDFTAHVEFRLPFMPNARGQGRGNSGFFPQGHNYEVQILDSFGLEGKKNECGGVHRACARRQHVLAALIMANVRHRLQAGTRRRRQENSRRRHHGSS